MSCVSDDYPLCDVPWSSDDGTELSPHPSSLREKWSSCVDITPGPLLCAWCPPETCFFDLSFCTDAGEMLTKWNRFCTAHRSSSWQAFLWGKMVWKTAIQWIANFFWLHRTVYVDIFGGFSPKLWLSRTLEASCVQKLSSISTYFGATFENVGQKL